MMKGEQLYSGKAKTVYATNDPKRYIVKFRDDVTAGDGAKKSNIKGKGYYNAQISARLFKLLADNGISTHYIQMVSRTRCWSRLRHDRIGDPATSTPAPSSEVRVQAGLCLREAGHGHDYKNDAAHDPMLNDDIAIALNRHRQEGRRSGRSHFVSTRSGCVPDERDWLPDSLEFGKVDKRSSSRRDLWNHATLEKERKTGQRCILPGPRTS
jgi:phosphoribosylaminoimidazole-succinocarboxamide synthase